MVPKHLHFYSKISLVNFHLVSDLQILLFITMEICDIAIFTHLKQIYSYKKYQLLCSSLGKVFCALLAKKQLIYSRWLWCFCLFDQPLLERRIFVLSNLSSSSSSVTLRGPPLVFETRPTGTSSLSHQCPLNILDFFKPTMFTTEHKKIT